jgi:O-antigen ligase
LRRILIGLVLVKVAGIVILFTWSGQFGFDLVKALWSRAVEWPTAAALVLTFYRYGLAALPRTRLHLLVVAFVAANAVAVAAADDIYISVFGERNRYLGLTNTVDMAILYLAAIVAFRSLRDWLLLGATVAGATLVAVAYGTIQYTGHDPITWGRDPRDRPFGTIGNEDMFGHLLATVVTGCTVIAAVPGRRATRGWAVLVGVPSLAMLALTGTRGSLLSLDAALGLTAVIAAITYGRRLLRPRPIARGLAIALVVGLTHLISPTGQRLSSTGPPVGDRVLLIVGSFHAFLARPLLGWGPDGLAPGFASVRPRGTEDVYVQGELVVDQAHNWILQAFATTGIVGGVALVVMLGAFSVALLRHRTGPLGVVVWPIGAAAVAYWINGLTSPDAITVVWIPWLVFACTAWMSSRAPTTVPVVRALPSAVAGLVFAASLAAAATGWNAFRANAEIFRAVAAYAGADPAATIAGANAAIALDPGRADYWNYRGLGFQLRGQFALAAADFLVAAERVPYQPNYWINVSRARAFQVGNGDFSSGGVAAALAAARRAVAEDPFLSAPHRNYAEIASLFGDPSLAVSQALIALDLFQGDPTLDPVLAEACIQLADQDQARRVLEGALVKKPASAPLWVALAAVHLNAGDLPGARAAANRALELDPASADAKQILGRTGP